MNSKCAAREGRAFFFVLKVLIRLHISCIMRTFAVGKQEDARVDSSERSKIINR